MKLYTLNDKGNRVRISLADAITKALESSGFSLDNGEFDGEDHRWVGIIQENKNSQQVTINLGFNEAGDVIQSVHAYVAPIRRVVIEDDAKMIV